VLSALVQAPTLLLWSWSLVWSWSYGHGYIIVHLPFLAIYLCSAYFFISRILHYRTCKLKLIILIYQVVSIIDDFVNKVSKFLLIFMS
jgi:hypothetical protein